tara:strand:- start:736 stop:1053 length:318 start_codon:yes stop_codon:yes gene_type:complete
MDLQSVISKNIDEYLKPKYPIYRVKYIVSELDTEYDDLGITTKYKERICELREKTPEGYIHSEYFDEDNNFIYEKLVKGMKDRNYFYACDCRQEQIVVIGLERLA